MIRVKNIPAFVVALLIIGAVIWYAENKKSNPASSSDGANIPIAVLPNSEGEGERTGALSVDEKAKRFEPAIEISTPDAFLNAAPFALKEYVGKKVILVDFWTYSCINCQRTLPYLNAWHERYADKGLLVVGLHTPEFEFEKDVGNVRKAVEKFGVRYPVVLDNDYSTWQAYKNRYWPRKYLIDIDGYIVYDHIGEGGYEETEKKIQKLIAERAARMGVAEELPKDAAKPSGVVSVNPTEVSSPEIYFGAARNELLGGGAAGRVGEQYFEEPIEVLKNALYLIGAWNMMPEYAETSLSVGSGEVGSDRIDFLYSAKNVYFVAGTSGEAIEIEVLRDSGPLDPSFKGADVYYRDGKSFIKVGEHRLYNLVSDKVSGEHLLELIISKPGLRAYTFTFG